MIVENNQINTIINNSIEGILVIHNGFIKDLNNTLLEILEYNSKDEIIGNLATGLLIPTAHEKFIKYNSKTFQELSLITKNGVIIPVLIKIINLENDNTTIVYIMNLTDLKEKENMLLSQSKYSAMGEMITMIAHQWRQPLNSISGIIAKLLFKNHTKKLNEELLLSELNQMDKQIQYMSDTIEDFRNFFSKSKKKEYFTLNDIIDDVLKILSSSLELNNIQINIKNNNDLSRLYSFKNDFIQVFVNLLNNSKDAFNDKNVLNKRIDIRFEENNKYQIIFIKDNAGGISNDILSKIFNPYFTTKDHKNGTGLGLYICKTILEKNLDGQIYVCNNDLGVEFKIEIEK